MKLQREAIANEPILNAGVSLNGEGEDTSHGLRERQRTREVARWREVSRIGMELTVSDDYVCGNWQVR